MATEGDTSINLDRSKRQFESEITTLKEEVFDLRETLTSNEQTMLRLNSQIQTMRNQARQAEEEREEAINDAQRQHRRKVAELEDELGTERARSMTAVKAKTTVEVALSESQLKLETLERENNELKRQMRRTEQHIRIFEDERLQFEKVRNEAVKSNGELEKKLRSVHSELTNESATVSKLTAEKRNLEQELADSTADNSIMNRSTSLLKSERDRAVSRCHELENKLLVAENQVKQVQEKLLSSEESLNKIFKESIEKERERRKNLDAKLDTQELEMDSIKRKLRNSQLDLEDLKDINESLKKENQNLRNAQSQSQQQRNSKSLFTSSSMSRSRLSSYRTRSIMSSSDFDLNESKTDLDSENEGSVTSIPELSSGLGKKESE